MGYYEKNMVDNIMERKTCPKDKERAMVCC
jgi:hypothetical protein